MDLSGEDQGFYFGANYRLETPIGEGASGVVWRGIRKTDGSLIAAKLLREEFASDPDIITRFIHERTILTALRAPEIVSVLDLVAEGNKLGIVMEYIPGSSLRDILLSQKTLPEILAAEITLRVLRALAVAHAQKVVHQDIKPDNILAVAGNGNNTPLQIKLTDFGISKILGKAPERAQLIGTPEYMSPELIASGQADAAADIYAVGIMLYEMLSGHTPFAGGEDQAAILQRHLTYHVPGLPHVSEGLAALMNSMLVKDPAKRPDAETLIAAFESLDRHTFQRQAFAPTQDASQFIPATIIKPLPLEKTAASSEEVDSAAANEPAGPVALDLPDFTPGVTHTILRPLPDALKSSETEPEPLGPLSRKDKTTAFLRRLRYSKAMPIVGGLLLIPALVAAGWFFTRDMTWTVEEEKPVATARSEDNQLPSGLTITREAEYNPNTKVLTYKLHYRTAKNPLSGPFFELLTLPDGACAEVDWTSPGITKNVGATTSIMARCGWTVDPGVVPQGKVVTVEGQMSLDFGEQSEGTQRALNDWLSTTSEATISALMDESVVATSYAAQRLQGMRISGPGHVTSGQTIPLTITGLWPHGEDTLSPLLVSPGEGELTSPLKAVTANHPDLVRFSERCQGAASVSADGRTVTALFPTNSCEITATIGNYDVQPTRISITGHGS
ncbi:serine/threonine-protein kinase [Schaalia canis]|uniref:Serine/threonine protein kinase n=1 Tax=Schaalia canis TaxID=100469 RepID=A0A3P1SBN0_9ACTO|nr:serine/threonine-protein kinase [Schaalia canis]RRC94464.1 serine/threonine protein kinase [Schaalia canis]